MGRNVLLVQKANRDSDSIVAALRSMDGMQSVRQATDGKAALKHVSKSRNGDFPCVVLVDHDELLEAAFDVIVQLRSRSVPRHLPLVVFSSSTDPETIARFYSTGANSYIRRAADLEELKTQLTDSTYYWCFVNAVPR